MTMPIGYCPHCRARVDNVQLRAELAAVDPEGHVRATQRNFVGDCPEHGTVFINYQIGHHSTIGEALLGRRYDKATRRRISARLCPQERRKFRRAINGKYHWTRTDLSRWDRLARMPILTSAAARLAMFGLSLRHSRG